MFINKWSVIGHWKNRKNRYIFITAFSIVARMLKCSQYDMGTICNKRSWYFL